MQSRGGVKTAQKLKQGSDILGDKKYYWLKLKRDFFKRHDIQIIEGMPNGKDYVLFYLKLLVESVDHDGALRFNDTIPYNEQMLSTITNTNIDTVRSAMKVFTELSMIDVLENQTIFMTEVSKMLGSETFWAEKKRTQRAVKSPSLIGQSGDNVQAMSKMSKEEIEIEIEIDKEKEIYKESADVPVDVQTLKKKFEHFWLIYPKHENQKETEAAFDGLVGQGILADDLIESVSKYKKEYQGDKAKYISKPENYLNKKIWLKYLPKGKPSCQKCHGKGYVEKDNIVYECECIHRYDSLKEGVMNG